MTSLKFHFDDGSEYLAHYGKVGMHWGEWNEQTQAKYASNPDLIGEFAKALNTHAYNQSYQDQRKMNPVEAGAKSAGAFVTGNAKKFVDDSGRAINDFSKQANEFSRQARNTAVNISKEAQTAVRRGLHDASVMASHAQRALSSVASTALENGKKFVDSIFGTHYAADSRRRQASESRKRRAAADKRESLRFERKVVSNARARGNHQEVMSALNYRDKAKRKRAMDAYNANKAKKRSSKTFRGPVNDISSSSSSRGASSEARRRHRR